MAAKPWGDSTMSKKYEQNPKIQEVPGGVRRILIFGG
jgi:hypothetical protein